MNDKTIVLSGDDLIPDQAAMTVIRGGWQVQEAGGRVALRTADGQDYGVSAQTARLLGAALVQHAERAADSAEVSALAAVIGKVARDGVANPQDAARAVWGAGYRKAET